MAQGWHEDFEDEAVTPEQFDDFEDDFEDDDVALSDAEAEAEAAAYRAPDGGLHTPLLLRGGAYR